MGDVADNRHLESVQFAFVLPDGQRIEQCLSRMFVRSIAGIDDARFRQARYSVRRS